MNENSPSLFHLNLHRFLHRSIIKLQYQHSKPSSSLTQQIVKQEVRIDLINLFYTQFSFCWIEFCFNITHPFSIQLSLIATPFLDSFVYFYCLVFVITIAFVHLAFCVQVECQIRIQLERHIRIRETHINLVKPLAHFIKQSSKWKSCNSHWSTRIK